MSADIAILIPTLGRPQVLAGLMANLRQTTRPRYRVCFVIDAGDAATQEAIAAMPPAGDFFSIVSNGTYPEKTNAGVRATDEDLVLPTADDVVFHSGWLEAALPHFAEGVDVVGTLDLTPATARGQHATMPIVQRSYIEDPGAAYGEPGVCFHEGYHHNFVETELWQLALHRGVAVFERGSVIEHLHPDWGSREADETDRQGHGQGWDRDKALFERRRAQWTL
jgi:glycosyltransferase involved in cell wall biosynthesis